MQATKAAIAISIGGLWSASCGTVAQPLPPPGPPPPPPSGARIVAYTWEPVTPAADRLICAVKVDRRRYDVQQVAAQLRALPRGHRVIRLWKWADPDLTRHPADRCRRPDGTPTEFWYPKPTAGVELVRLRWRNFLVQLRRTGTPLDEVIVDYERGYDMWGGMAGSDKVAHLAAIQNDPRFRGVSSKEGGGLTTLERVHDYRQYEDFLLWNAVMHGVVDAALQAAIYEPLSELYPKAHCSNFNSCRIRRDLAIPALTGLPEWWETDGFGTHDNIAAYANVRGLAFNLPLRDGKPLGSSPYAALLHTIKRVETADNSSPRPFKVWIAPRDQTHPGGSRLKGTVYHDELLRHLVVRRYGLIYWNGDMGGDNEQMLHTNAILEECAGHIGETGPARPHDGTAWKTGVIQSTTHHGDQVVHRFTLEHPRAGLRYRVNGVNYHRNLGPGEVGVWVTHARGDDFHVVE